MSNIQDFKTVTIRGTQSKESQIRKGNYVTHAKVGSSNAQTKLDIDLRKVERGETKLPKPTKEMSKEIQLTRTRKGWTQEDLAKKCGLSKDIIRDYENGKAIVKQQDLQKINKVLGLRIRKPKAEKNEKEQDKAEIEAEKSESS